MVAPTHLVLIAAVAVAAAALGCSSPGGGGQAEEDTSAGSDDASNDPCVPGQTLACECDDGRAGAQLCQPDGVGYDECVCSGCEPAAPPIGLQRLTRAEYNRTVRDLFDVTSDPADAFPPDSSTNGFDNNAKSLTISVQLAELLLDTAEEVAAEAMINRGDEIIRCDPNADAACARTTLDRLALRVYRRPPSDAELDDLEGLVQLALAEGDDFATGIEHALVGMLMSPQFLYRNVPTTSADPAATLVPLPDHALATRLSYFLWGSTPDDALLERATQGALSDTGMLRAEFDRMLADPKSAALYDGFMYQWLQLGKLAAATPDGAAFPTFDEDLRAQMLEETRLFFDAVRARDGSALEIVTSTQTFANASIAEIYGVAGVDGDALVPIETDPSQRAGVLTMPAILTMTSDPAAPNIVKRGVWLAEAILCAAPPPPPVGVPPLPDPQPGETERERLERHREDPSCGSCHNLIDPLGFAFEGYDALGGWRTEVDGEPVDDLGTLPDGREFEGVVELAGLLATGPEYPRCITGKLMTYGLGRPTEAADACSVDEVGASWVTPDASLSDLLWAIVTSDAFRMQQESP